MHSYQYLLLLLAPAAVLSAPFAGTDDAISNLEAAAPQPFGLVETADLAPRGSYPPWRNVHSVIEVRAEQMHEAIEIPSDQMSGVVRVTYDPDLEANDESLTRTSPVPRSPLAKRGAGSNLCNIYTDRKVPRANFLNANTRCVPEKSERAYEVYCKAGGYRVGPFSQECPNNYVCFQLPDNPEHPSEIECRAKEQTTKASSSTARGIIRTITKFFTKPPANYKKLHFDAYTIDRNGHQISVPEIKMIVDGSMFKSGEGVNSLIVDKVANPNGEGIYFLTDPHQTFVTLEWWWRRGI
ncbi:hypothetical protein BLS_004236 [Venturia inaequalis]|uniref:Uncharacterized protein n=1 Tax=Venturia inaequalis TaxID=5025 RepID=A0A8H3UM21_VENIN|nr:hypothetical protein BLS_004236 [Venturia inaequalis]